MLKLEVERSPMREHHPSQEVTFEATLRPVGDPDSWRALMLSFDTNADGLRASCFRMPISFRHFAELARMMVEVDPAAAIHAFGTAMQSASIQRKTPTLESEKAA